MVAIFTGLGAGFERGSGSALGMTGLLGGSSLGRGGEQVFLNGMTGNLMVSRQDEFLVGQGPDVAVSRTYNSLDARYEENGDGWRQSTDRRLYLTGTANAAGSSVVRVSADGSIISYAWNGSFYGTTEGSGAHDRITYANGYWTWIDGSTQVTEKYARFDPAIGVTSASMSPDGTPDQPADPGAIGGPPAPEGGDLESEPEAGGSSPYLAILSAPSEWRIVEQSDTDGNKLIFSYTGTQLTRITTADNSYVSYAWSGSNIVQVTSTDMATGTPRTIGRTRYAYDGFNRLTNVTVDLTPEDNSILDTRTYVTTYTYDSLSGGLASIGQSDGSKVEFGYAPVTISGVTSYRISLVRQWVDALTSRTTSFVYSASGVAITDPAGAVTQMGYDPAGRLVQITAPSTGSTQPVTKFEYDFDGNVTRVVRYPGVAQADSGTGNLSDTRYAYDSRGNAIEVTDSLGNITRRTYGFKNELLSETRPLPGGLTATTRYIYDSENHLRYVISPESRVTEYRYTAAGLLDRTIDYAEHVGTVTTSVSSVTETLATFSFETPEVGSGNVQNPVVSGVTFSGRAGVAGNGSAFGFPAAPDGDQVAYIQPDFGIGGSLTVTMSGLTPGRDYSLKFMLGGITSRVTVSRPGNNILGAYQPWSQAFQEYSFAFTAWTTSDQIVFSAPATGPNGSAAIDNIRWIGQAFLGPTEAEMDSWRNGLADRSSTKIVVNGYDSRGNLASTTSYGAATAAGDPTTSEGYSRANFVYDQAGQLLSRTVDGRSTERFVYDGLGRVIASTDLDGGRTSIVFNDSAGRTVVMLANGFVKTSTYNRAGELINYLESGRLTPPGVVTTISSSSFETPEVGTGSSQNPALVPSTGFFGISGIAGNGSSWGFAPAPDGDQVAYIQTSPGGVGTIVQSLSGLAAGAQYLVKFSIGASGALGAAPITVSYNGTTLGTFTPSSTAFQELAVSFTAGSGPHSLTFSGLLTSASRATAVDKVTISLVSGGPTYGYDQRGLLRVTTDATGFKSYFVYDRLGRKVADVNALGDAVEYVYDALNRAVATARYATRLSPAQLTALGDPQAAADIAALRPAATASDLWTWQVYDRESRLAEAIEGDGRVTAYEYDSVGRLVRTTAYANPLSVAQLDGFKAAPPAAPVLPAGQANDSIARNFYDKDGLLVGLLDGEGFLTRIVYDKAGQKVEESAYAALSSATYRATGTFDQLVAAQVAGPGDRRTRYVYDGQGQLRYQINGLNELVKVNYDPAGQVTGTVRYPAAIPETSDFTFDYIRDLNSALGQPSHPDTRRAWTVYNSGGRAAYSIDAAGGVSRFFYDNVGQVVKTVQYAAARVTAALPTVADMDGWAAGQAANPANRITRNYYTPAGELRFSVDAEGFVSGFEYDSEGRMTRSLRWAAPVAATDSDTLSTIGTLAVGAFIDNQTIYDPAGRVVETVDGEGFHARLDYNANGTLASETVAYGHSDATRTTFVYDRVGRVTEQYRAQGTADQSVTRFGYDGLGNLVSVTDPNGNVTIRSYDRLGRVTGQTDAQGGVLSYQYNAFGEAVKVTDPRGYSSYNYYDRLGRLTAVRDFEDYVTELGYNAFGELASNTRRINRAINGASASVAPIVPVNAQDSVTRFYYDRMSRLVVSRDSENYLTETGYDSFGEVISVTRRAGRTSSPVDPAVAPTAAASPLDAVTRFEYDRLGRLVKATDAENYYEQYGFDSFGRRTSFRNKLGGTTTYGYDRRGLLLSETLPIFSTGSDGLVQAAPVTNRFEYDGRGNRTKAIEASGLAEARTTTFVYDKADRQTETRGDVVKAVSQMDHVTESDVTPTQRVRYDPAGNAIETVDALGARTLYYYDRLNRRIAELNAAGTLSTFAYDSNGNVERVRVYETAVALPPPNTAGGSPPAPPAGEYRETVNEYDRLNRVTRTSITGVRTGSWNGGAYVTSVGSLVSTFQYDSLGNVIKAADPNGGAVFSYYDSLGRLVARADAEKYLTAWTLDAEGNALSERRYALAAASADTAAPPAVAANAEDRITNFTYDRNGRRLTETRVGVSAYAVNQFGSLLYTPSDVTIAYAYNGLGQVTRKTEATGDATDFAYDLAGRLTKETHAAYADQNGATVRPTVDYSYDGLDQLTVTRQGGQAAAAGDRISRNFYVRGRLSKVVDATGAQYEYGYDVAGNLVREVYNRQKSDGTVAKEAILYGRDQFGRTISQAVAAWNGAAWSKGDVRNIAYNAFGEVSQRGTNGLQEQFAYDKAGRLWRTNSGDGVWRYFIQDGNGNQTLAVESEGTDLSGKTIDQVLAIATNNGANAAGAAYVDGINVAVSIYDKRGLTLYTGLARRQLSETAAPTDIIVSRGYNAFGETAWEKDAKGNQTFFGYNTLGRTVSIRRPAVSVTLENGGVNQGVTPTEYFFYDVSGRLVGTNDANGRGNVHALLAGTGYGSSDALTVAEFHPDGGVVRASFDVFGDARKTTDEVNRVTEMSYDGRGRLTQVKRASGLIEYFGYDLMGQRIRHWNSQLGAANVETTDYDVQGRVVSEVAFGGDRTTNSYVWSATLATAGMAVFGGWTQTTTYANGKTLVEQSDMFGREVYRKDLGDHEFRSTYDLAGRLIQKAGGETLTYSYLNTGLVGSATTFRGSLTDAFDRLRTTYSYDSNGNKLTERTVKDGAKWVVIGGQVLGLPSDGGGETDPTDPVGTGPVTGGPTLEGGGETEDGLVPRSGGIGISPMPVLIVPPEREPPEPTLQPYSAILQDASAAYDSLNRMTSWNEIGNATTPVSKIQYEYDANGNVRRVRAEYATLDSNGNAIAGPVKDQYYRYDSMNRVVTSQGVLSGVAGAAGTQVVRGSTGIDNVYDKAGQRVTSTRTVSGVKTQEIYDYDGSGQLYEVRVGQNDGPAQLKARYQHDLMGRLTEQKDFLTSEFDVGFQRNVGYNAKGQILTDVTITKYGSEIRTEKVTNKYGGEQPAPNEGTIGPYSLGAVVKVITEHLKNGALDHWSITDTDYAWWDGAVQSSVKYTGNVWEPLKNGTSTFSYNGWGQLSSVFVSDGRPRTITFTNNIAGEAIRRDERDNNAAAGDPHEVWYRFDGRQLGYTGNNGTLNIDYQSSINARTHLPGTGAFRLGDGAPTSYADFDQNYSSINSFDQGGAGGSYTVRSGETLASIAAQLWGDSSLWYKLAEANGMSAGSALIEGQRLTIPSGILKSQFNASTFKPYDPAGALGDISPTTPQPPKPTQQKNKCGVFGQILLIAVAVAVTFLSQGALAGPMAGLLGGSTLAGNIAAGAIAGAIGSAASQTVGLVTGIQDRFDWKGVAMGALSGAVSGGVSQLPIFRTGGPGSTAFSDFAKNAARGALSSAATQGIGVATGLQGKFSWAGVAAAGIGAGVTGLVADKLGAKSFEKAGNAPGDNSLGNHIDHALAGTAGAIAAAATQSLIDGSDFGDNVVAGLASVIGSTIGNLIAYGVKMPEQKETASAGGGRGAYTTIAAGNGFLVQDDSNPYGIRPCGPNEPGCIPWEEFIEQGPTSLEYKAADSERKLYRQIHGLDPDREVLGLLLRARYGGPAPSGPWVNPLTYGPAPPPPEPSAAGKAVPVEPPPSGSVPSSGAPSAGWGFAAYPGPPLQPGSPGEATASPRFPGADIRNLRGPAGGAFYFSTRPQEVLIIGRMYGVNAHNVQAGQRLVDDLLKFTDGMSSEEMMGINVRVTNGLAKANKPFLNVTPRDFGGDFLQGAERRPLLDTWKYRSTITTDGELLESMTFTARAGRFGRVGGKALGYVGLAIEAYTLGQDLYDFGATAVDDYRYNNPSLMTPPGVVEASKARWEQFSNTRARGGRLVYDHTLGLIIEPIRALPTLFISPGPGWNALHPPVPQPLPTPTPGP
jgi:YD repeat-containing protein